MSNNPATWGTFDEAIANIGLTDGIGFVVTDNDLFTGIDFDDCINPKTRVIEEWALDKIKEISTYWQVSLSELRHQRYNPDRDGRSKSLLEQAKDRVKHEATNFLNNLTINQSSWMSRE